jgi:Flp pilus assembly protein TadB
MQYGLIQERGSGWMWLCSQRRTTMDAGLDKQCSDLAWSIATGLRAGYDLRQVFTVLSSEAPEPAASASRLLLAEFEKGPNAETALATWKQALPSAAIGRLAALLERDQAGGSLPDLLDPLSEDLLREYGSDPAFYDSMRRQAEMLGARVPERVSGWKDAAAA